MTDTTDYDPQTDYVTEWGIGIYNDRGDLTRVRTRREVLFDPSQRPYTEETARHDAAVWVQPNVGAWAHHPDLIRPVSRTIKPWRPAP